ncbi:unnamed protein product [Zymoseptoria tritici ST99CH_1A5]|uniref:Amidohydrolase-related domain-containing protein n=2 Tax=Zymoseptoria tritici TaxID=1047171 RepID=A0A1X7RF53_ZYMT9|nr:unnamed protein product [Zymoseptoria tritici ST99CH_3D7]SMY19741.1 unnamed protein product [Zymoseptoria tritici ST99CH_1A5]
MEKDDLPKYSVTDEYQYQPLRRRRQIKKRIASAALVCLGYLLYSQWYTQQGAVPSHLSIERLEADYAKCAQLRSVPKDPSGPRDRNARFVDGHNPVLIRNATVWTGEPSTSVTEAEAREGKGYAWTPSDVLLENGLIIRVEPDIPDHDLPKDCEVINVHGRQLTAGIVDMHSHAGVDTLPVLEGSSDDNELSNDITPYVRSLDGLNPLDPQIRVIMSGGVTTSLILPGSGNNIAGSAFVIKHAVGKEAGRPELSIESLLADPDKNHRYIKMACGENAKNVYGQVGRGFGPFSRLGEAWYFRRSFEKARNYKEAQDDWCAAADRVGAKQMTTYLPSELEWETLSAVLRGQVFVNTHCYTIPDLESFIGYTNEFKFQIRAFHHGHSTPFIPEVLKRAYGGRPPAAALFADNMYYKAESYLATEQAGKMLYESGLTPVYVSDNPVLNAQHVVFEAAKAHKNGLKYHVALAGVTSASAELLGLGERIGKVKPGFDADVVVWDSDPLAVGATPIQVFIDGVAQFKEPIKLDKPLTPPLGPSTFKDPSPKLDEVSDIVITGVTRVLLSGHEQTLDANAGNVVVSNGSIVCMGACESHISESASVMHLQDGHIAPALTAFGSLLGLEEIASERDTQDGANNEGSFSRAIDGLKFEGKGLAAAFNHGVTKAISAPKFGSSWRKGVSAGFRVAAKHALEKDAVFAPLVALHYTMARGQKTPSTSSTVADLKYKLLGAVHASKKSEDRTDEDLYLSQVVAGNMSLVIGVHSADTIASLLRLKHEVEAAMVKKSSSSSAHLRLVLLGAAESHLLAEELAAAKVGVFLAPLFSYATTWDQRRALTGAPLTNGTAIDVLHAAGVKVAIGVDEDWESRDLYLQAGTVLVNGGGKISEKEALGFVDRNIYDILGIEEEAEKKISEFVVSEGSPLTIQGQIRAVADGRGMVRML